MREGSSRSRRDGRFITAACLKLAFEPDSAHVVVACGGHPAPILVPRVGAPTVLAADGDLVGILATIRLRTAEAELRPGDSLVAYTDGVTDQGPGSWPSPERALRDRTPDAGADELVGVLEDLARQPGGPHRDDIAIVALRFLGREVEAPRVGISAAANAGRSL